MNSSTRTAWLERRAAEKAAARGGVRASVAPLHRGVIAAVSERVQAVPKSEQPSQHAGYMASVRALGYCMNCGKSCRPQFCHADQGKGMGIKTDVRRGWPGCAECHWLIGTSGHYTKDERRGIEARLAHKTRAAVVAAGTWPARLPMWEES